MASESRQFDRSGRPTLAFDQQNGSTYCPPIGGFDQSKPLGFEKKRRTEIQFPAAIPRKSIDFSLRISRDGPLPLYEASAPRMEILLSTRHNLAFLTGFTSGLW